jgi:hypothetical protein
VPLSFMLWRRKDGTEFPAEPSFASYKTKEGTPVAVRCSVAGFPIIHLILTVCCAFAGVALLSVNS